MSSYSGEIGLQYRTAYCASKFAVTGFFESLRMELGDEVDITIICPVTVETSFRDHGVIKIQASLSGTLVDGHKEGSSLTVGEAINVI